MSSLVRTSGDVHPVHGAASCGLDTARVVEEELHGPLARISGWLLACSLSAGLSILFLVYFYEFDEGEIAGGELPRLLLKILASVLLFIAIRWYLSLAALSRNVVLKLPLLFVAANVVALAPLLEGAYIQALNLLFFLPLLLVDWNKAGGTKLYQRIWAIITVVVAVQALLDPLCKAYFHAVWRNAALIGGMGNPSVFGVFLVCCGLAAWLLLPRLRYMSSLLFALTLFTASLASLLVAAVCLVGQLVWLMRRAPVKAFVVIALGFAALSASALALEYATESNSILHALSKLDSLVALLSSGESHSADTVSVRLEYTHRGLDMLGESPLGIVLGHPGGTAMYNGDGLWTSFLVTYGLPLTLSFLAVNLVAIGRALRSQSPDLMFSGCVVAAFLVYFATNRILDYWPAALAYLLAFSYVTVRGVRPGAPPAPDRPAESAQQS